MEKLSFIESLVHSTLFNPKADYVSSDNWNIELIYDMINTEEYQDVLDLQVIHKQWDESAEFEDCLFGELAMLDEDFSMGTYQDTIADLSSFGIPTLEGEYTVVIQAHPIFRVEPPYWEFEGDSWIELSNVRWYILGYDKNNNTYVKMGGKFDD